MHFLGLVNSFWEPNYPAMVFTHSRKEYSMCVANNIFSHITISSCNDRFVLCSMYILEGGLSLGFIITSSITCTILSSISLLFWFMCSHFPSLPFFSPSSFYLFPSPPSQQETDKMSVGWTLCPVSPARVQLALIHQNTSSNSSRNPGMCYQQAGYFGGRCLFCPIPFLNK